MVCRNGDGWGDSGVSLRDRVKPSLGEGMAAGETPQRQPRALEHAEPNQRHVRILRARGQINALCRTEGMKHRRQNRPVQPIDATHGEAGLEVWHRVTKPEAVYHAACLVRSSPPRSGSRGTRCPPRAPAPQTQDRSRFAEDEESHPPASAAKTGSYAQPHAYAA